MVSVVIELFAGIVLLGTLVGYQRNKPKKVENFGRFCICYTKGKHPGFTYIPWISRTYRTEEDLNFEEGELATIALDKDKNSYFREQGFTGFAVIDMATGDEMYWCALAK